MRLPTTKDWCYIIPRLVFILAGGACLGHAETLTMPHTIPLRVLWNFAGITMIGLSVAPSILAVLSAFYDWFSGAEPTI